MFRTAAKPSPSTRRLVALDGLAALGFTLLPHIPVFQPATDPGSTLLWAFSACAAAPLAVRRIWPSPVFLTVLLVAVVALPLGLAPTALFAASYALYEVAVTRRRPGMPPSVIGGITVASAGLLAVTGAERYQGGPSVMQLNLGLLTLGLAWAAGSAVRERQESVRLLVERTAERAAMEERLRIARDLHDVVSHSVGLIAVKAGIANHVLASHPEEAHEALRVIERVSRQALEETRTMLTLLRPQPDGQTDGQPDGQPSGQDGLRPAPGLVDLPLLTRAAEAAGVRVCLRTRGIGELRSEDLPAWVELSAHRIVQEALTNVIKHAAPTQCLVSVVAGRDSIHIEVTDDGPGSAHRNLAARGGWGLVGMRERVAAHGGTVAAGPRPGGGFQVVATLPFGPAPGVPPAPSSSGMTEEPHATREYHPETDVDPAGPRPDFPRD